MPAEPTKEIAESFFDLLKENQQHMGEEAALRLTLEEFGYTDNRRDVLSKMAEKLEP